MNKQNGMQITIAFILSFIILAPSMSLAFEFPQNAESRVPLGDKVIAYVQNNGYTKLAAIAEQIQKISHASFLYQSMLDNAQELNAELADFRESFAQFRENIKNKRQDNDTASN